MDHRVLAHYGGDLTRVNVHPRVRDKVFAKYGVGDERSREEQRA
jgi:alkane 1-monooxygenase